MFEYPQYDEDGQERLSYENIWQDISPQEVLGADCFNPYAPVFNDENLVVLKLTGTQFTKMFSALYNGAIMTYPQEYLQIITDFLAGIHCPPLMVEQECYDYPSYAAFMQYSPMNPYLTPDEIPEGYEAVPFLVNNNLPTPLPGYEDFDIFVPFDSLTLDVDWWTDIAGQLPTITIMVNGAGKAFLKFLPMLQGGIVCVTLDNPPNILDILGGIITGADNLIDMNMDSLSIPPETAKEIIYEVNVEGSGIHTIYAVFLPIIDDSFIPVRFGGGFRGVQLCNFVEEPEVGLTAIRLNPENCTLETQINGEWIAVSGWDSINDCVVPNAISSEAAAAAIESNATILEMQTDIQEAGADIVQLEQNVTQTNIVPANPDYSVGEICNAAEYIATQIIALANQTWTDSGTITIEEFLAGLLESGTGYIANLVGSIYEAAVPSHSSTPSELAAAKDDLVRALYCNELDKAAAIAEIAASGSITTYARDLIVAALEATSDAKYSLWAFVGAETASGDCDCGESFLLYAWNYISFPCSYGLPSGWSLVVNDGVCGDNGGLIKGIHDSSNNSSPTTCVFTITPASGVHIREINYNGVKKSGGVGTCQVACGGYSETDTLQATVQGFLHIMDETGAITFTLNQSGASNNGVAVQAWNISYEIP